MNASSEQDVSSVMANSKCEEQSGVATHFEMTSERKDTFHELN